MTTTLWIVGCCGSGSASQYRAAGFTRRTADLGGVLLAAAIGDFRASRFPRMMGFCGAGDRLDYVPRLYGEASGPSKEGIIGSGDRHVAGCFSGLWGLLFMRGGAAVGELIAHKDIFARARSRRYMVRRSSPPP